ncbi:MAG: glycosyltransferase family 9 protein [Bacteroidales bacterium]
MKKILIIRFSSIGDIVLTTPVVRCLKQQIDNVEIHYLTRKSFYPILKENPYLSKVYFYENSLDEVYNQLKAENYDLIIDLHKNIRSLKVKRKLKEPVFSFPKLNWEKWVMVNFKRKDIMPDIHIVDRYMKSVESLGVKNDQQGLDYFIPEDQEVSLGVLPESFRNGYLGIVIGGAHATKVFPEAKLTEVIGKLDIPIVLLGGPGDREMGERVIKDLPKKEVFNSCGRFSLHQSASLVSQASCILTNDTGLMHIAAAFKVKTVSVWGNTVPELGMYPYFPKNPESFCIIENSSLKCRPCSKIGYKKCPKKHFKCMNDLDTDLIVGRIKDFMV